jgi:thiamine biosynthesis protein ThiI
VGFVHFHSYPFTGLESLDKVMRLVKHLGLYQASDRVTMVPFGETQQQIAATTPERLRILLYRRFMVRIAERLAASDGSLALVTGESLAQVASQTLENLIAVEAVSSIPIVRPLIGLDKMEIIETARSIGTYETSIEAHDDCCSFLMPRQPATRAKIRDLQKAEEFLPVDDLVGRAIDEAEVRRLPRNQGE